jgi:hypothetical protein
MEKTEARKRLDKIMYDAARFFKPRTAAHIEGRCVRLANLSVTTDCAELAEAIREERAIDGWPGDLSSWTWFDDKLFALAQELDCTPVVARASVADRARVREGV